METFEIFCPFCNDKYTAKMVEDLKSSEGCDTCEWGNEPKGNIDIVCENCKKLVYRKEI